MTGQHPFEPDDFLLRDFECLLQYLDPRVGNGELLGQSVELHSPPLSMLLSGLPVDLASICLSARLTHRRGRKEGRTFKTFLFRNCRLVLLGMLMRLWNGDGLDIR